MIESLHDCICLRICGEINDSEPRDYVEPNLEAPRDVLMAGHPWETDDKCGEALQEVTKAPCVVLVGKIYAISFKNALRP